MEEVKEGSPLDEQAADTQAVEENESATQQEEVETPSKRQKISPTQAIIVASQEQLEAPVSPPIIEASNPEKLV